MAKATTTTKERVNTSPQVAAWLTANQELFNRVAFFYFEVITAHERILDLSAQQALTALEHLTHATRKNLVPLMPLTDHAHDVPAMFRRAAIHAALGSARSFFSHLKAWRARKEKAVAKKKAFNDRPPVPPRTWKKSVVLYAGQCKERMASSIMLKLWTGSRWNWIKVHITGRTLPPNGTLDFVEETELLSPSLVQRGDRWYLHTPIETTFTKPETVVKQVETNENTRICAVDLNLDGPIAVCTIQTVEGTTLATLFLDHGRVVAGLRKRLLGRIARNRSKTGMLATGEQDNVHLWRKIQQVDEHIAHLVSARIVEWAWLHEVSVLVFEHLGSLKPAKGRYSRRGNTKRAFWMKGRIVRYATYKAWGRRTITSRVNPRNTSRECARCHKLIIRYAAGQPEEGYTPGVPLVVCPACGMRGNADRNASMVIGQRLIARTQKGSEKKPSTPLHAGHGERGEQSPGEVVSQDVERGQGPAILPARHGDDTEHGTAQEMHAGLAVSLCAIPHHLRCFNE